MENIIIIGSGPAGHTAAVYAARANLRPVLYEGLMAGGVAAGGQLTTTTDIENFPGFPEKIGGPELMNRMRQQSERYGTAIITETVNRVDFSGRPYTVYSDSGERQTHAVIIATGAIAKRLRVPHEDDFWQKGISACAVCDGGLPIFRNRELYVIGGGDTACEEAIYLTNFASKVTIVHRRDELRASKTMARRVMNHDRIDILWDSVLVDVEGDKFLERLKLRNVKTQEAFVREAAGLFYAIGHTPNTAFLDEQLKVTEDGYLLTECDSTQTELPGVFAAGDVQDSKYRQAVTSAGSGCMAALEAERWLGEQDVI